jgi:glycosyltransferase involved in cell wall biosynthesis
MKVIVISSSPLVFRDDTYHAYSPYVRELEIWAKHAGEISFMCPVWKEDRGLLISAVKFPIAELFEAREFNIKSSVNLLRAVAFSFGNFQRIYRGMRSADHIHLRCPGNIGLMGCLVQMLFPNKPKTAKYAGNWDPKAVQPWSYRIQKWILNNTFLTRKMSVLVYGEWEGSSKNIKPFFTASYCEDEKFPVVPRMLENTIEFIYAGTLAPGKRTMYAIRLVEALYRKGHNVRLSIYGHGPEKKNLEDHIHSQDLGAFVFLKGNRPQEMMKDIYSHSHFLVLPSKSEGWPKVVAEAMFWGCLPVASQVSCIPFMLGLGSRGILLDMTIENDVKQLENMIGSSEHYSEKVSNGIVWSRQYTLDLFENEIKALLHR